MATIQALAASVIACALATVPASLRAQDRTAGVEHDSAYAAPRLRCWRGQPAPACATFVITEIGAYRSMLSTSVAEPSGSGSLNSNRSRAFTDRAAVEIGMMRNLGLSSALGATVSIGGDGHGLRIGARGRYRRWLSASGRSLDISSGIIAGSLPRTSLTAILSTDVALNLSDYGALVAGIDLAHTSGQPRAALFGGARLGSKPGLITTGLAMIIAAIGVVALASWNWE